MQVRPYRKISLASRRTILCAPFLGIYRQERVSATLSLSADLARRDSPANAILAVQL